MSGCETLHPEERNRRIRQWATNISNTMAALQHSQSKKLALEAEQKTKCGKSIVVTRTAMDYQSTLPSTESIGITLSYTLAQQPYNATP